MTGLQRVVIDTSTLMGAVLRPASVPRQAFMAVVGSCELCMSPATLQELHRVLGRAKFDRYAPPGSSGWTSGNWWPGTLVCGKSTRPASRLRQARAGTRRTTSPWRWPWPATRRHWFQAMTICWCCTPGRAFKC
ncbi:MAG: PIN domain-containing protein [Burkholderiaceae bacterium]|nr:MAG: PIN domain-containing protein [Burkholderiaceae bacterium]TBR74355.1 MAG: PIN domain-containing protein [Burkholderiaceae bacterium]